jgi:ribonucleoside-diphosphate reductase alpha chain
MPLSNSSPGSSPLEMVDPIHKPLDWMTQPLCIEVWQDKYAYKAAEEHKKSLKETIIRTVEGVYAKDVQADTDIVMLAMHETIIACIRGLFMPAGRILAGAGTAKLVTLMNCYVNSKVDDSMTGIMESLTHAALTMQQGGGVGTCFSTIRPKGAKIARLGEGAIASGPLPFMRMWNSMCSTIMSAGSRRGAMMGTICDTHPDLLDFIYAKQKEGELTNFNLSILVSDAFMAAVADDEEWLLHFNVPPVERDATLEEYDFEDDDGNQQYVYAVWRARDLWEKITKATYEYSEPGVIFVDRINGMNNLAYLEDIQCTNPCGEQPLPPHGTCNLGAVILSRMVKNPFTEDAYFDFDLLKYVTRLGVRFLDNVIDVTNYPLNEQANEEMAKRRLGLGIAGLADALAQLGIRYGSLKAAKVADEIMRTLAIEAYEASVDLAIEKGPFPLFNADKFLEGGFVSKRIPESTKKRIREHGIRNGLLLTIAPTGTTSIVFGNISSGVEPVFAHQMSRKVLQPDDTWKTYDNYSFISALYQKWVHETKQHVPALTPTAAMVVASDLTIAEHIRMQAACQHWIDASVSKTVNVPKEMSYDEFVTVYNMAYSTGCKGCTTYRPSDVRGSILDSASPAPSQQPVKQKKASRADALAGFTYKVRWPSMSAAMYITINKDPEGKPYEMFFASKDARHSDWMTALTLMISGILRSGIDPNFVPTELKQVTSMHDTAWINGKFYASPVAYIGHIIEQHLVADLTAPAPVQVAPTEVKTELKVSEPLPVRLEVCPQCNAPAMTRAEGCKKCTNCTYTSCQ